MFKSCLQSLRAVVSLILFSLVLAFCGIIVHGVALLKLITPVPSWRRQLERFLNYCPKLWTDLNKAVCALLIPTKIEVQGLDALDLNDWYLMTANHQSWTDIYILYAAFNHSMPVLKIFMKSQLAWIPIMGTGCKLIGYPFMKRYSHEQIVKNPSLKGKDLETTKKMCERFKLVPMTILSFAEGTRFTKAKAKRQQTPYEYLLKPRAGGLAFTLSVMGDYLKKFVDVTIIYEGKRAPTFWDFLCGRVPTVKVVATVEPITSELLGDYVNDPVFKEKFQSWLNAKWQAKDNLLRGYYRHE